MQRMFLIGARAPWFSLVSPRMAREARVHPTHQRESSLVPTATSRPDGCAATEGSRHGAPSESNIAVTIPTHRSHAAATTLGVAERHEGEPARPRCEPYCNAAPGSANQCASGSRTSVTSAPPSKRTR
jgi:hypothetical protein